MGYKMLIIEDEVMIRKGLACFADWKAHGITEVREAGNGAEGLEMIRSFRPDIVITDICMPIRSGLEIIEETMVEYKYVPIIISGYSDFEYAQKAIEYGVTAYLLKPVDTGKLLEAVEKAKQELHKQNLLEDYQTSCREFINNELISGEKERQFGPIVSQMLDYIHEHYAEKITLGIIAKNLHYSENFILRRFKDEVKANFSEYLSLYRISQAMEMMRSTDHTLSEIALLCGFSEYKYFRVVFTRYVGCTPKDFQRLVKEDRFFAKKQ
ncbi:MAG: response regulator [Firmicutes bacterium]|nr:response regulator [Bacillota bacterium]MBQ3661415.1 response regulator [Bacillota bacterium]MBQ4410958.1 response regulator [Bacillota bacterium]MBR0052029.1 response regulator [Bacillota bacterium]MBR0210438.1 response regulator [Bacillota bacterium]